MHIAQSWINYSAKRDGMFCPQPSQKAQIHKSVIILAQPLFTNLSLKLFGNGTKCFQKQLHILIPRASSHTLWKNPSLFHGKVSGVHKQLHCSISTVSILRSTYYTGQRSEQRVFPAIRAKEMAFPEWENGNSSTWSKFAKNQGKSVNRNGGEEELQHLL